MSNKSQKIISVCSKCGNCKIPLSLMLYENSLVMVQLVLICFLKMKREKMSSGLYFSPINVFQPH